MPRTDTAPAAYSEEAYAPIHMVPVESNQVAAVGYDAERKTLAVTFTRGAGAIYHYPNVEPDLHQRFMDAESKGTFFGKHVKHLPFKKFPAPGAEPSQPEPRPPTPNDAFRENVPYEPYEPSSDSSSSSTD